MCEYVQSFTHGLSSMPYKIFLGDLNFANLPLYPPLQMSTTTPATRTTRSPSTTASTAAARGQMPAWTHAVPSWNGTPL